MGSIVIKEAGQLIPDDALSIALKKFSKGSGLALATEGTLEMSSQRSSYASMTEALEEINKIQCPLKAETLVYYFTNYPDKLVATDEQPFILIADEKEEDGKKVPDPMLLCFIDGAMSEDFEPDASGHTREYMAVNSYLAVKMQRLYAQVGNDLEDFLKLLEDPLLKRELMGTLFEGPGDLVMIAASGEVMTFSVKSAETAFEWGWMSDPCGYGEAPDQTLPASVTASAKGVLASIKSKGVLETIKAGVTATTSVVKPDTSKEPGMVWARPPSHIVKGSNNKMKAWYESRIAVVPENWKSCPAILMTAEKAAKESCQVIDPDKKKDLPDGVHSVPDKKDTTPHHISTGPTSPVPLISNKQQDYIVNEFLKSAEIEKTLDANSQSVDPLVEEETKYPTFCEKAGLPGLESTLRWSYAGVLPLFKTAPEAAALLFINMKSAYINQLREKPKAVDAPKPSTPAVQAPAATVVGPRRKRM